mmetsp:Transcript_22184/g.26162  ORF Transcript_22184/g.26162 Transcript_22184/m.26162 type:complete len:391 (-) Transcript_22184:64-1236(-)
MITIVIPPKDQISRVNKMLTEEYGTASRIKSHENRLSVLSAITSTQQKLKQYNKVPDNGLVLFCGLVVGPDGKGKKTNIAVEPFKPVKRSLYLCDKKFHTECLKELLDDDADKFGFIVMDGNGCLYGTLQGNNREILHQFSVDLPKKHGRGGQSALRFARLRLEKRHNYVRKVAEIAASMFISTSDHKTNVKGLVLCGSAEFKNVLASSDLFDERLRKSIIKIVDVSYGGNSGFNQAIDISSETLGSVKLVQEKRLLQSWYHEVAVDSGKYCFMMEDTIAALEQGAVQTLLIWENINLDRLVLRNQSTKEEKVIFLTKEQQSESSFFFDTNTKTELEIISKDNVPDYFAENYKKFGCTLEFVTDRSQEGSQFCRGFGGIGGLLRWKLEFN